MDGVRSASGGFLSNMNGSIGCIRDVHHMDLFPFQINMWDTFSAPNRTRDVSAALGFGAGFSLTRLHALME